MKYVKGRYTIMKNKKIIYAVIIAVGIIGVAGLLILGSSGCGRKEPVPAQITGTLDTYIDPGIPGITDIPVNTPVNGTEDGDGTDFDPSDPIGNGDVAPDEIPDSNEISVVDATADEDVRSDPAPVVTVTEDKVTAGEKKTDEVKPFDLEDEILNDAVIEAREEAEKKRNEEAEKDDRPVTVISTESSTGDDEDKPVSVVSETDKAEGGNAGGNAPVFVDPAQGGSNPFEGGDDSEIDDHGSDEFIVGDGDRPGEGIHF